MQKKLEYADYEWMQKLYGRMQPATCEDVLVNSFIWKDCYHSAYVGDENGLFWVNEFEGEYYTSAPVCKKEEAGIYLEKAKNFFHEKLNRSLKMYAVDEEFVKQMQFDEMEYEVEEDRDGFDYLYDAEALRRLSGKKYHQKKNHINAFLREYEGRYEESCLTGEDREEIFDFLEKWHENRPSEDGYHRDVYELQGVKELITHRAGKDIHMFGIRIDGKLEAFSLASMPKEETVFIHVEKANPAIRGLYPLINRDFLCKCFPEVRFVNREDDLGLEGLRKAKLSYHPVRFAKKYNVFEREECK